MTLSSWPWSLGMLVIFGLLWLRRRKRPRPTLTYPGLEDFRSAPASFRVVLFRLRPWLQAAMVLLLVLALARPRAGKTVELVHAKGVDIMVALDVSGSMAGGRDLRPNRLTVAKQVLGEFISGRKHDRIGMVIFAGAAFTRCPLTLDYGILLALLEALDHKAVAVDGTAIGTALAACVNRLRESDASSKVAILITDGANNSGSVAPEDAAAMAKELGIKLYTIGVGARDPAQINSSNVHYSLFMAGTPALDEPLLRRLAEQTGGRYFRATDAATLQGIFQIIDRLEKSELETQSFTRYRELFWPLLVLALGALVADMLLGMTLTRSLP